MFTNFLNESQNMISVREDADERDLNILVLEHDLEYTNLTNNLIMLEAQMNVKGAYAKANGDEESLNEAIETLNEGVGDMLSKAWEAIKKFFGKIKDWVVGLFKKSDDKLKKVEADLKKVEADLSKNNNKMGDSTKARYVKLLDKLKQTQTKVSEAFKTKKELNKKIQDEDATIKRKELEISKITAGTSKLLAASKTSHLTSTLDAQRESLKALTSDLKKHEAEINRLIIVSGSIKSAAEDLIQ